MMPTFLIVEADLFVAEDLREIIVQTVPGAQILQAESADEGLLKIVDNMPLTGVFLSGRTPKDGHRHLIEGLAKRSTPLVTIGLESIVTHQVAPWHTALTAPFTQDAIEEVLSVWVVGVPNTPPADGTEA